MCDAACSQTDGGGVDKVMVRFKVRVRVSLRIGWYVAILGGMAFKQAHTPANS